LAIKASLKTQKILRGHMKKYIFWAHKFLPGHYALPRHIPCMGMKMEGIRNFLELFKSAEL
jgi:hypothetical protein